MTQTNARMLGRSGPPERRPDAQGCICVRAGIPANQVSHACDLSPLFSFTPVVTASRGAAALNAPTADVPGEEHTPFLRICAQGQDWRRRKDRREGLDYRTTCVNTTWQEPAAGGGC